MTQFVDSYFYGTYIHLMRHRIMSREIRKIPKAGYLTLDVYNYNLQAELSFVPHHTPVQHVKCQETESLRFL